MQIQWLRRARHHLEQAARYIASDNPEAARQTVRKIQEAVAHLAKQPEMGRQGRVKGTRELVIPGTPYIVAYRLPQDRIEILCVLHSARRWPEFL